MRVSIFSCYIVKETGFFCEFLLNILPGVVMPFKNQFFYVAGIAFLALAKTKSFLKGYSSPKPFDVSEIDRCVEYDIHVVNHWLKYLRKYTDATVDINGKNILELGPGSDLGVGLYLLALGAAQYNALDVNYLIKQTPMSFYEKLFEKMESLGISRETIEKQKEELEKFNLNNPDRLNYVVRDDFDLLSAFGEASIDIVFSQAAFEHFDDVEETISKLSKVCKKGAILVAEVDLKTHSRWIRDKDPNNIYRYPRWLYNLFRFRGIPNRVRPFQYKNILEKHGWKNVQIFPLETIDKEIAYCGLHRDFLDEINQMEYLSIMLCAKKA